MSFEQFVVSKYEVLYPIGYWLAVCSSVMAGALSIYFIATIM